MGDGNGKSDKTQLFAKLHEPEEMTPEQRRLTNLEVRMFAADQHFRQQDSVIMSTQRIVQQHLTPHGAVIVGVPNCRTVGTATQYGARMRNFRQPELGLLIKDVAFYRKYLQQHDRQVYVTGKNYLLVTGVSGP